MKTRRNHRQLKLVMKVTTGVDHFASKKQFGAVEHFAHGQFTVGVLICQLYQVVGLQMCMVLVVGINVNLQKNTVENSQQNTNYQTHY